MTSHVESEDVDAIETSSNEESTKQGWSDRRLELVRTGALLVIAVFSTLVVLYITRAVLFPIVLALLLNLLLSPLVRFLKRFWLPEAIGAAVLVAALLVLTVGSGALLLTPAARWLDRAPASFREVEFKLRSVRESVERIGEATKQVDEMTEMAESGGDQPIPVEVRQPGLSNTILNTSGNLIAGVTVTTVLLYFLLASGDRFLTRFVEMMPTWKDKRAIVQMARNVQRGMSIYLLTTTAINAGLGVAIGFAMWACGLPNPALWGVMAALLNYLPFIGALVGTAVVGLVGLLEYETATQALLPPILYIVLNALEANFVTPTLVGRSVSLNPVMVFLSLVIWGWMWGVGGAIIAVPLLAVTKIYCDSFESLQPVGRLLGD